MRDLDQHASGARGASSAPEPVRQYLISQQQVRTMAVLSAVGMAVVLIGLLLLATARPQGRFQRLDPSEFQRAVTAATADLDGYELLPDGRARIDIDRAMELVAQRGVGAVGIVNAAAAAAGSVAGATPPAGSPAGDAAGGEPAGDAAAQSAADIDGATAYALCAACHQGNGMGIPGAFPPLAGHGPELYVADRTYPILVLLYGVMGQIQVSGMTYNGLMPAHGQLGDANVAAILNYVMTSFGNADLLPDFEAYEAADVAAERDRNLSFTDVYALRSELGLP
ncbi:MAG TPA: cytochrome c [Trueperaceae bacterium]|nr:cytochrome c [Trueperaceae bacterium]